MIPLLPSSYLQIHSTTLSTYVTGNKQPSLTRMFKAIVRRSGLGVSTRSHFRALATGQPSSEIRLTFFTKENCMLCAKAKAVLDEVLQDPLIGEKPWTRNINLEMVDIESPSNKNWFDCYRYDIPVLHIDRDIQTKPVKFMHSLSKSELLEELTEQV
ncbi:unnamed protein product [Kuraishia capsulata CBS 1993]|uniref:Glutaredoxin-like protein n=1 Tax=Kuraishia capsulata CBS 1993 TaxID=1382522 RepID=W6MGA8_9ASCO|nr:uncharacterized protein KUCA_T00000783001 [Kuraishia capsulata CBS 1993]CDK24816.1 unnamed protein product [Kuraishia capsulata CBS 1993]